MKEGPVVEDIQLAWVKPKDVGHYQLVCLIPRALLGLLAY
jgi:hypothetical protein